jgi:hypothetical protein
LFRLSGYRWIHDTEPHQSVRCAEYYGCKALARLRRRYIQPWNLKQQTQIVGLKLNKIKRIQEIEEIVKEAGEWKRWDAEYRFYSNTQDNIEKIYFFIIENNLKFWNDETDKVETMDY